MAFLKTSFKAPYRDKVLNSLGFLSETWAWFIRSIEELLYAFGQERSFNLLNNQTTAADIQDLKFNKEQISQVTFEYLIHRVTTSTGATELVETGILLFCYNPTSDNWSKVTVSSANPDNAGVTITITSAGQVQYTSTNISGTESISVIHYRARTLKGKNSTYSKLGSR